MTSSRHQARHSARHVSARSRAGWAAPATLKASGALTVVAGLALAVTSPAAGALAEAVGADSPRATGTPLAAAAVVAPAIVAPADAPAGMLGFTVVAKPAPVPARPTPSAASRGAARPDGTRTGDTRTDTVQPRGDGSGTLNRHDFSATGTAGLTASARRVFVGVMNNFPQIKSVIGVRPDSIPDHPSGRAIDFMVPNWSGSGRAVGDSIVAYVQGRAGAFNVDYIIFRQRIWFPGSGWRSMSDRGSATANHYDHVHVSVR